MTHEELLSNVSLNTPESEREIIARSKGEVLDFDTDRTWLDYFSEIDSDNIAVVDENRTLTYRQLEKESNSLAAYLIERGVKANDFVALCMDRCVEFVVAVVAIHKAGAAYVPIDINYPEQRRNFMLEDSEAKAILTREIVLEAVKTPAEAVNLSVPDGYVYMIYTSGSTGQPKGTILHHRGLLNFTMSTIALNKLTSSDRIGHHFSFSFDSHIEDLYPPLVAGASIHIMQEAEKQGNFIIMRGETYEPEHGSEGSTFTARAKPYKYNGKNTWAIVSLVVDD